MKLKILFTIPNFDTAGSGKALLNVAKNLDENIFQPQICCAHNKGEFFKVVQDSGIPIHIQKTYYNMIPRLTGLYNVLKLALFFRRLKINLIHSFHYGPDYSEALASRIAGIPWVYTKKNMNWGGLSKNGWYLRTLLAKYILVQNRDMISEFFPNSKKISLVPRGVDLNEFKKKPKNLSLLKKYNLKYEDKIILCVANLHPVKGVEVLIKAFELLSQNKKEFKLFIVGENKNVYGEQLLKIAQSSKYSSDIIFTGKVNNVSEYYSLADLFVLPTHKNGRREGCPVSLLEAISSGINVLGSDVSGIKDILEKFPNLIFESGNSIQLYNKIKLILRNGKTLNKAVKNHIKQYYNIKVEAENHQIVYKKILIKK